MTELHKLIMLQHKLDQIEQQMRKVFNNKPVGELLGIQEVRNSLWSRIMGEIDAEKELLQERVA